MPDCDLADGPFLTEDLNNHLGFVLCTVLISLIHASNYTCYPFPVSHLWGAVYRKRETTVDEALVEMYLAGVFVRRVDDVAEILWGSRVSAGTVSELNQKAYVNIEK